MNAFYLRTLNDAEIEHEITKLEVELDRLDDAPWPGAHRVQAECMEHLLQLRAEQERRRC